MGRLWLTTGIWAALSVPLAWAVRPGQWNRGTVWACLLVGFFLLGVWLLVHTVKETLAWRRYRGLVLELDPVPGSPGGQVGGRLEVPLSTWERHDFRVTLSCIRVSLPSGGEGGKSRWESVVWTRSGIPRVERAGRGLRLGFTFDVPDDLPPSEEPSDRYHRWTVRMTGAVPGLDLDEAFEVPVFESAEPRTAERPVPMEVPEAPLRDFPPRVVRVEPAREGVRLRYPAGRGRTPAAVLVVVGLAFAGFPAALATGTLRRLGAEPGPWEWIFLVVGGGVMGVFFLVGLLFLALGAYLLVNSLEVVLGRDELETVRRVGGIPFRRRARIEDVERLELAIEGQVGQGSRARVTYDLRAFLVDGGRLVLGDGIPGPELGERLASLVEERTGLSVDRVGRGERTSPVAWRKAAGRTEPGRR